MAKRRKHRNASRGSVNNIILRTLSNGDKYGYEIIKEVEEYSDGKIKLKQPSLYSSLTRFEEKGLVSSYWGDSDIGGRRHYYHMTDAGFAYYKIHVLKETSDNESDEVEDDDIESQEELECIDENNKNDNQTNDEVHMEIHEVDPDTIPSIANFDSDNDEQETIPDDAYHEPTPLEIMSETNTDNEDNEDTTTPQSQRDSIIAAIKENNRKHLNTPFRRLHYIRPKQKHIIILDRDGIYKLRDADYVPSKEINKKPNIIDNVGRRTKDTSYGYADYTDNYNKPSTQKTPQPIIEMTEDERKRRNEIFLAKFNELSKSKMKVTTPQETKEDNQSQEEIVDYKSKLDVLLSEDENNDNLDEIVEEENNLFNYEEESETEDKFVDFDNEDEEYEAEQTSLPVEETTTDNYNKEISQYSSNTIKINRYENTPKAVLLDRSYVLVNKLKFIFGFLLLFILLLETTISVVLFNSNGLIDANDKTFIIITYVAEVVLSLVFILPYLFNPHEHKLNNYKPKYAFLFGLLTFLICLLLIYCINALAGFELDNFKYFAVELLLPSILSTNFIICPLIYGTFVKMKIFYD